MSFDPSTPALHSHWREMTLPYYLKELRRKDKGSGRTLKRA